jgi:WD40 repeat protein
LDTDCLGVGIKVLMVFQHNFKHQKIFDIGEAPSCQALSPDGRYLVTGYSKDGLVKVWDTNTGQMRQSWVTVPLSPNPYIETIQGHRITALAISPDGETLITGGKALKSWELSTGKQIRSFKGFGSWVSYIRISPNGQILLTDGTAGRTTESTNIWHLQTGKKIRRSLSESECAMSPNGKEIVGFEMHEYNEPPKPIKVRDLMTGKILRLLDNEYAIRPRKFTFSPDGKFLAGSGFDGIKIWIFETGKLSQRIDKFKNARFHVHLDNISTVVFSPDGKYLFSTGSDEFIQAWDVDTGENVNTLKSELSAQWIGMSVDGKTLLGVCGDRENTNTEIWKAL